MRVGLLDLDATKFPNIPLMKISSWHKQKGDLVEWYEPFKALAEGEYDKVYISKVFSFTPDYEYPVYAKEVTRGGSGYAIKLVDGKEVYDKEKDQPLAPEIEHIYPDYSIYGITDTAYGFLTRGCPRGCDFCHIKSKEGTHSHKVANLKEFWRGQKNICLCDANILACKERIELLEQLAQSNAYVDFNQGLDIRLLTDDALEVLQRIKLKRIHFAYDRWQDKELIEPRLKAFKEKTSYTRTEVSCYVLTNFDTSIEQDIERIQFLRELQIQPYVMIYDKEHCKHIYKDLQRWCNPFIFWNTPTLEDYKPNARKKER